MFGIAIRVVHKLFFAVSVIFALPAAVVVSLLDPWLRIRVGYFHCDRLGHFIFDVEYYLVVQSKERSSRRQVDIFFFEGRLVSHALGVIVQRKLCVIPSAKALWFVLAKLPGGSRHMISPARAKNGSRDINGDFAKVGTSLAFSKEEDEKAKRDLAEIGLSLDRPFVCLMVRDEAYLNHWSPRDNGWSYHNYRDSSINLFYRACRSLSARGYSVVRMGSVVKDSLISDDPQIIDYATSGKRTELLDLWLAANCEFAVSTATGLDSVCQVFRRPVLYVNFLPLVDALTWQRHMFCPKRLRLITSQQELSLQGYLESDFHASADYESEGVLWEDLSPKEIEEAVLEMIDYVNPSTFSYGARDQRMRTSYWRQCMRVSKFRERTAWIHPEAMPTKGFLKRILE